MISKIDIPNFGLYNNFSWETCIGKNETFRKLNIIYGRNYSGKTTLARVFKCFEDNILHKNYTGCGFNITLSDGSIVKSNNLSEFSKSFKLRVYNTDFVKENLSWIHNDDGSIKPFTILGAKNIELDKRIKEFDENLGSIEGKTGLLFDYAVKNEEVSAAQKTLGLKKEQLQDKLTKRANDKIKINRNYFIATPNKKTYTIRDIEAEIEIIKTDLNKYTLQIDKVEELQNVLKENQLEDIPLLKSSKPKFLEHYNESNDLLKRKIKPTNPIQDLLNDNLLQEWVRQGINLHKDKRTTCGFCNNPISTDLWAKLNEHFSKESDEIRETINQKISILEQSQKALMGFITVNKNQFYKSFQNEYESIIQNWTTTQKAYSSNIGIIISYLIKRRDNIFSDLQLPEIIDESENLHLLIQQLNELIVRHNVKTTSLFAEQSKARLALRYSEIAQFLLDIGYTKECALIKEARDQVKFLQGMLSPMSQIVEKTLEAKRIAEMQAKDESKGAELINQYLTHYFGHNELKLIAEGESSNIKFKITREGNAANNLSEGECSLISFCYFIAKIEDELKDEHNSTGLIIYIDDPISSLDSNHIFFMFSLIEGIIAKPKKYCQLFISTHNLDFLKYLKRLTIPKYKPTTEAKEKKPDVKHFIIERYNKDNSKLKLAPTYLKDYVTEFNYLFGQIYQCSILPIADITEHYQYNFGNNMRKFLEAHLFYKYPNHKVTPEEKLKKYFGDDNVTAILINRLINEYSHLGEQFERGMEPIDATEIQKVSKAVMLRMQNNDEDQYLALMESIT